MKLLSPLDAVHAAESIYRIANTTDVKKFGSRFDSKFEINKNSRFEGTAGALIFKYQSGFGIMAKGKGKYKDDAIIAFRGTHDFFKDLFLTDGNIGLQHSNSGHSVHAGFNNVFTSFEKELRKFFRSYSPCRVHCVGHSLGGALATIVAEWIARNKTAQPILYTFGSPRVGLEGFVNSLTNQMGSANIYRAYHRTDVVSMVPLWPFLHAPQPGVECYLESPGFAPGIEYHKTEKYLQSVSKAYSWDELKRREPPENLDSQLEAWLNSGSFIGLTANTIYLANECLLYILKKVLLATGITIQTGLIAGLTLMDQLAMALDQAAKISKDISGLVTRYIIKILKALGEFTVDATKLTYDLIKWVLVKFSKAVYELAMQAIRIVHQ